LSTPTCPSSHTRPPMSATALPARKVSDKRHKSSKEYEEEREEEDGEEKKQKELMQV